MHIVLQLVSSYLIFCTNNRRRLYDMKLSKTVYISLCRACEMVDISSKLNIEHAYGYWHMNHNQPDVQNT